MSVASNIKAGRAYVEVTAETSKLQRNLSNAKMQLQDFGKACTAIGKDLLMFSGAIALPMAMATKSFADFDDKMRLAQAVTQSTTAEFETLTAVAQRLGRETSFTAQQVAEGMGALGRAGFSSKEIVAATGSVLDLSRATGTALPEAADIAGNSLRIFALDATKMTQVADVLVATANGSAQTLTDLFEALKMVGPQAKAAGETIDETCASLGVLANVGIKGSLAGTALRKAFMQFSKTNVQQTLKSVGVETVTATGDLRKMADIIADVGRVMSTLPTASKLAFAEDIFDVRGALAGLSLGDDPQKLEAFLDKLNQVEGVAARTAKNMDAGLGGAFRLFTSAVEGVSNALGKALESDLAPLVKDVTAVTNSITRWIEANKSLVTNISLVVASVAALGASLLVIGTASKALSASIFAVQGTMKAFSWVLSATVGSGSAFASSIGLITRAFSDYRNAAVPALVGTSKLLAALNLPIDVRSKQIAASLVLMSNAETAAAAKSVLASKFTAAGAALSAFNITTLKAIAVSKAHAIALAMTAAKTHLLTAAKVIATKASTAFTVANLKAVATTTATGAANAALAISTKAVAASYLGLNAILRAFTAIPLSITLGAIAGGLVVLGNALSKVGDYTARLSNRMSALRGEGDKSRQTDLLRMERLTQLSEKQSLSNEEMSEAERLTKSLTGKYGDFGVAIDDVSKKLNITSTAQAKFNEAMKKAALQEIDAEIVELTNNIDELSREINAQGGYFKHNIFSWLSGTSDEALRKIEDDAGKMDAIMAKLKAVRQRKLAITENDEDALVGDTDENAKLQKSIATNTPTSQKFITDSEAQDATKRALEIEDKLRRENQTTLENEIEDIVSLRDEYKELIRTMLAYEKSRQNIDTKKVKELEGKLAEADTTANTRIETTKGKQRERLGKEVKDLQASFDESETAIQTSRADYREEKNVDKTLKSDRSAGLKMMQDIIKTAMQVSSDSKARYVTTLNEAQADGTITDTEKSNLDALQNVFIAAEAKIDKYARKLEQAQEATVTESDKSVAPIGSFYAKAMESIGATTAADRTAKATESIEKNTKKTNSILQKVGQITFS